MQPKKFISSVFKQKKPPEYHPCGFSVYNNYKLTFSVPATFQDLPFLLPLMLFGFPGLICFW